MLSQHSLLECDAAEYNSRLTLSEPVPDRACTVALRFSLMTPLLSPNASLALSSLNLGLPVMPRYSCTVVHSFASAIMQHLGMTQSVQTYCR